MASNIALKTFKGGNVTPQDDAIIYQTVLPGAGVFKGCEVSFARSNILHISQGFGMIKGRFFEMYETEIAVKLADTGTSRLGRLYIHMDLSNTDDPIQILTETATELSTLASDTNVNYNNTSYDLELAKFKVTSTEVKELVNTFRPITAGGGGGGGAVGLERETKYSVGDTTTVASAPGWCTLYCTKAGATDVLEPQGYSQITKVGDSVLDGTAVFEARNTILELTQAQANIVEIGKKHEEDVTALEKMISDTADEVAKQMSSTGNLVQKIMSISDYQRLGTYDKNTMYYCYDNADTQEIKFIYLGQHVIYATGITVTYQVDTGNVITQVAALSNDAVASAPTVTKAGYTFVGWKSDDNADSGVLEDYVIKSETPVKLYAVFKKQITISMDSGDATIIAGKKETSQKVDLFYNNGKTLSDEVVMPENIYELSEDKSFCGWKINLSDNKIYIPGESYKFTKDEELVPAFIDTEYDFLQLTSNYVQFHVPADGIYEFELWGGAGGNATGTVDGASVTAKGGKGGHVKAYKKLKKDTYLYMYNGGKGGDSAGTSGSSSGGYNGGGNGYTYNSSSGNKYWGAGGGGATYVSEMSVALVSNNASTLYRDRARILLIAGGGGGAGVSSGDYSYYNTIKGAHPGGYAGGERGEDGSQGNLGGRQTAVGQTDYYNFGGAPNFSGSNQTYSGGGAGWFAGMYGQYGNSGAGGSSYVGNMPTFTHNGTRYKTINEKDVNPGAGYAYVRYMEPCKVE